MEYIETPIPTINTRKGGKDITKMSKPKNDTPVKVYQKTRGEHVKDVMIAILVAGIIAFIAGMHFANKQNAKVSEAVNAVTLTQSAEAAPAKK